MTDGSQFIDIILFAMVALFLGLRLRSVLGRRTGNERPPADVRYGVRPGTDNVVDIDKRRRPEDGPVIDAEPAQPQLAGSLRAIQEVDPAFTPDSFLQGARGAFEMIVTAFARGDKASLRPLLSEEVFENFRRVIDARTESGETSQSELLRINSADIEDSRLDGRKATVSVRFVSQQIIVVKNAQGNVVEGDPSRSVKITDLWTFERDIRATNPNWLLVATRSLDE